ncbi:MAG: hypothetical protein AAF223_17840, partial [Bacteroidota bacterium]
MTNYFLRTWSVLAVGLCWLSLTASAQRLAVLPIDHGGEPILKESVPQQVQKKSLKSALQALEQQYQVFFNYDDETIKNIEVQQAKAKSAPDNSLEEVLSAYLKEHQLGFKKLEEGYYMIYSVPAANNIAPMQPQLLQPKSSSFNLPLSPQKIDGRIINPGRIFEKTVSGKVTSS